MMADVTTGDRVAAGPGEVTRPGQAASAWPGFAALRQWWARRVVLGDIAGTALFVLVLAAVGGHKAVMRPSWWLVGLEVALVVPLVLRRRYPLSVFCWMYTMAALQAFFFQDVIADAALLVALYTVAAHCDRRHALIAFGAVEVGVIVAVLRWVAPANWLNAGIFLTSLATAAWVLGVNLRTRRAYLTSLEDRAVRAERERDQRAKLAAAAERARIAREMHDIVAHNLSVMIALADGAAFAAPRDPQAAQDAAKQVSVTGRQALTEMHRLVDVLRSDGPAGPLAPQPGIEQIDDLVAQVRAAGLPTTFTVSGQPFPIPPTAQLAVYRVVQESLTNILKHAKDPSEARVILNYAEPTIILRVVDDGRGAPLAPVSGGHGVTGMRERAAVFGGWVAAGPRPAGGWQVRAMITCDRAGS
jgi:signal transduction histidine kinase